MNEIQIPYNDDVIRVLPSIDELRFIYRGRIEEQIYVSNPKLYQKIKKIIHNYFR